MISLVNAAFVAKMRTIDAKGQKPPAHDTGPAALRILTSR